MLLYLISQLLYSGIAASPHYSKSRVFFCIFSIDMVCVIGLFIVATQPGHIFIAAIYW